MKKLFSVLMVLVLIFSTAALAEGIDFASMNDAALHAMIDGARNELAKRELIATENTVLFEQDGVQVYLTGENEVWGSDGYYALNLGVVLINESDSSVFVTANAAYVNGWEVYGGGITDTAAGKKQRAAIDFTISEAGISTIEEIEELEIEFWVCDSESYMAIAELEPVTIHFNAQ